MIDADSLNSQGGASLLRGAVDAQAFGRLRAGLAGRWAKAPWSDHFEGGSDER